MVTYVQVRAILKKYKLDLVLILSSSIATAVLAIVAHGSVKQYTSQIAMIAPLVFAGALLLAMTLVGVFGNARWLGSAIHALLLVALLALFAPATFLEVEKFIAPYEWWRATPTKTVVNWITTDRDDDRIHAWARILTLSKQEKDEIAKAMAPLLLSNDSRARHSAELTLQVPLRQHSLATLVALRGELREFLMAQVSGSEPSESAKRTGEFASAFVRSNVGSIHKALQRDKRPYLPEGALEALFLALATEHQIGPLYLGELARHGDTTEKSLAESVLQLASKRG